MPFELSGKRGFGSDNHAGVHPEILKALHEANVGHAPSYGTDTVSDQAIKLFRKHFGDNSEVFFVFNGTAANTLALRAMTESFQAIFCSDIAHANVDECGAPEFFTGCKLIPLPSKDGKISASQIRERLIRRGDQHFSQPKAVTITQPTEVGTVYTVQEIKDICDLARREGLYVHVDGARLANAVVSLKTTFEEMIVETGVDAVSFGGTKNGLMFGEAVIFLKPELARNFKYLRKQGLNLPSKTRYIAAQFAAYWQDDLWRGIAGHSLRMAAELAGAIEPVKAVEITYPVQSNAVFARIPQNWVKKLREHYFFYIWDEKTFEARLMCSFDTRKEDIEGFQKRLREYSDE